MLKRSLFANVIFGLFIFIYIAFFSLCSYIRHNFYRSHALDLGFYDQVLWNFIENGSLWGSIHLSHLFGIHLAIFHLFLSLFYFLYCDPLTLLILQTVFIALGSIPIYLFANRIIQKTIKDSPEGYIYLKRWEFLPLIPVLAYFLSPLVENVNLIDYHPIVLSLPFLGLAFYFLLEKQFKRFLIFQLLALLVQEEVAIITFFIGIYITISQRRLKSGIFISILSLVYFLVATELVIPYFGYGHRIFEDRYATLGGSLLSAIYTIFFHPSKAFYLITSKEKGGYLLHIILSVGFFPFLAPSFFFLSLPTMFQNLLSDYPEQVKLTNQYSVVLIPYLFFAGISGFFRTIFAFERIKNHATSKPKRQFLLIPQIILSLWFILSPFVSNKIIKGRALPENFYQEIFGSQDRRAELKKAFSLIPPNASLSASTDKVPHLSHRKEIYGFPSYILTDYILVDLLGGENYLLGEDLWRNIQLVFDRKQHRLIYQQDGILIFQKGLADLNFDQFRSDFLNKDQPALFIDFLQTGELKEDGNIPLIENIAIKWEKYGRIKIPVLEWERIREDESYQIEVIIDRSFPVVKLISTETNDFPLKFFQSAYYFRNMTISLRRVWGDKRSLASEKLSFKYENNVNDK